MNGEQLLTLKKLNQLVSLFFPFLFLFFVLFCFFCKQGKKKNQLFRGMAPHNRIMPKV